MPFREETWISQRLQQIQTPNLMKFSHKNVEAHLEVMQVFKDVSSCSRANLSPKTRVHSCLAGGEYLSISGCLFLPHPHHNGNVTT